jgi:protein subunit release factor B
MKNKERTIEKFYSLLNKMLTAVKKRKQTRPNAASKEKRLEEKKLKAEKKERRKFNG